MFQTANVEAIRQAQEVSEELQREDMKKRAADDQMHEDQVSVQVIPKSDAIRTEERKGGKGQEQAPGAHGEGAEDEAKDDEDNPAGSADSRLDFLA